MIKQENISVSELATYSLMNMTKHYKPGTDEIISVHFTIGKYVTIEEKLQIISSNNGEFTGLEAKVFTNENSDEAKALLATKCDF